MYRSMFRMCGCQVVERALVIRISGGLSGHVKKGYYNVRETVITILHTRRPTSWSVGLRRRKPNDYRRREGKNENGLLNRLKTSNYYTIRIS